MRTLAIGDIHGCRVALETLLGVLKLDPNDTLITLGDYVDRGPDSKGVIDLLLALRKTHRVVCLRGNHELMMLSAQKEGGNRLSEWKLCGGEETITSYGSSLSDVPDSHWAFIKDTVLPYYETDTHIFAHAGLDPSLPLEDQPNYNLYWERFERLAPHDSGKTIICGHTSQKRGTPLNVGYAACIDTYACGGGWLSCLDATSGLIWQSNEQGQTRQLWLDDFLIKDW